MDRQEYRQFNLFINELKKYDVVDMNMAMSLITRFIAPLRKKRFFNENAKRNYYSSYWFRIAVNKGILENRGLGYKVHREIQ